MAVEPIIIYVESHLITNVSVSVESSAIALQSVVMIVMLYMFSENTEILVLIQSYGQLVYSLALVAGYYMYAWKSGVLRKIWPSSFNVDRNTLNEAAVKECEVAYIEKIKGVLGTISEQICDCRGRTCYIVFLWKCATTGFSEGFRVWVINKGSL